MNKGYPGGSAGKESACNTRDLGSIPGLEISSGEGDSHPLQYSGLENSMDCSVHGVAKSRTQLNDSHVNSFETIIQACCMLYLFPILLWVTNPLLQTLAYTSLHVKASIGLLPRSVLPLLPYLVSPIFLLYQVAVCNFILIFVSLFEDCLPPSPPISHKT